MHNQTKDGFQSPKIISIIYYVFASLLLVLAILCLSIGFYGYYNPPQKVQSGSDFILAGPGIFIISLFIIGYFSLPLSIFLFILATGLWRNRSWSRITAIWTSIFIFTLSLLFFLLMDNSLIYLLFVIIGSFWARVLLIFLALINGTVAGYLIFHKN